MFRFITREAVSVMAYLTEFVRELLPFLNITLRNFHSDGGAEFVAADILSFLDSFGFTTSHSPRDTPQINSVAER